MKSIIGLFKKADWIFHAMWLTLLVLSIRHLFGPKDHVIYNSDLERAGAVLFSCGLTFLTATGLLLLESRGHDVAWYGVDDVDTRIWVTKLVTRGGLLLCILIMLF